MINRCIQLSRLSHVLFILLVFILLPISSCSPQYQLNGSPYDPPKQAPEINLTRTNGEPFSLDSLAGKVTLLYFGYTHCPDICPATLAELKWVYGQLAQPSDQISVVFISIDPQRDTPARIEQYLQRFNENFIGLSGSEPQLTTTIANYGVVAQRDPGEDENYTMTHTSRVFLIDQQGILRTNYTFDETREVILADVRHLLED